MTELAKDRLIALGIFFCIGVVAVGVKSCSTPTASPSYYDSNTRDRIIEGGYSRQEATEAARVIHQNQDLFNRK